MKFLVRTIFALLLPQLLQAQTGGQVFQVEKLGKTIYEGVFTGNGLLGSMTYVKSENSARIDVGRTDVYDHRKNDTSALFDKARLPIGHFELIFPEKISVASGQIDYGQAEAWASFALPQGTSRIRTLTLAEQNIIYIEVLHQGSIAPTVSWVPEKAQSTRMQFAHAQKPESYPDNPIGYPLEEGGVKGYVQPLLAGGGYAVAYRRFTEKGKDIYIVTAAYAQDSDAYIARAVQTVNAFELYAVPQQIKQHRDWWKAYYQHSTLSIPDSKFQAFYNMQLYKLACATRSDKPAIDLQGPWTAKTPWPAYWHNLNIQLTYAPTFASNHLEITHSLIAMIDRNRDHLINNVPEPYRYNSAAIGRSAAPDMVSPVYLQKGVAGEAWEDGHKELGNLTWMLHSYYQYYRHSMDQKVYGRLFPLLKRAINYYIHLLDKDAQGKYHISVKTYSPEYSKGYAYDTNYDLSILKWGLTALIDMDNERGGKDALHATWMNIRDNLRPYPQNADGYMIAHDVPYAESHRHYSHLMMIYPFYDVNWDQLENRDLIERSIAHWQSKKNLLQGYSFSGVASMYAMMGKGNQALEALNTLLDKYVKPNTLYAETGPVIETPLAAMASIQEMVLQYWNGTVRVFPAVPVSWKNVSFEHFLTDGAFLVSGEYKEGKTRDITIKSQHAGSIKVQYGAGKAKIVIQGKGKILQDTVGVATLYLEKGSVAKFAIVD